jgi:predicted aldo/keto reductase-like oxidoreductase
MLPNNQYDWNIIPYGIKLNCKRCGRTWIYHGKNNYWACCPICKTSVNIPKIIRLLNEASYGNLDCEEKDKNSLDVRRSKSMTSSESTHQMHSGGRHG